MTSTNKNLVAIPDGVNEIGPFDGNQIPARPGMYKRVSPKSGRKVWAYWDGSRWCKYSLNIDKALQKSKRPAHGRNGRSRHNSLPWFALDTDLSLKATASN